MGICIPPKVAPLVMLKGMKNGGKVRTVKSSEEEQVNPISGEKLSENYEEIYKFKAYRQILKNQQTEQEEAAKEKMPKKDGEDDDSIDYFQKLAADG